MTASKNTVLDLVVIIRKHVIASRIPSLAKELRTVKGNRSVVATLKMVSDILELNS